MGEAPEGKKLVRFAEKVYADGTVSPLYFHVFAVVDFILFAAFHEVPRIFRVWHVARRFIIVAAQYPAVHSCDLIVTAVAIRLRHSWTHIDSGGFIVAAAGFHYHFVSLGKSNPADKQND